MSDLIELKKIQVGDMIYEVREKQVKFSKRFWWIFKDKEYLNLSSKISIPILNKYGDRNNAKVLCLMLDAILKSKTATEVSIVIIDVLIMMKRNILENQDIYKSLNNMNNKLIEHNE